MPDLWRPTTIRQFVDHFGTATDTVLVETDQGSGYLKAMGNRAGPHALACEWVGTSLAKWFGLSTFDFSIIVVTSEDVLPFKNGREAKPGPAFISRAQAGTPWGGKEAELAVLVNPDDIGRLVVFDTWTLNCDRYPPERSGRGPNRNNVFLSREGAPAGKFVLKAMDHTHCFTCGRDLTARIASVSRVKDDRLYGCFPEFIPFVKRPAVDVAIAALRGVSRSVVQPIVDGIPVEWEVDSGSRGALADLICERARYVADSVADKLFPQGELPFST